MGFYDLKLNLADMTPMDAMNILYKWQQMEKGEVVYGNN